MKLNKDKKFMFGSASSAFQVEGGANLDGRTDSIWDEYTKRNYFIPEPNSTQREINYIDVSADFYHNYKEDIKLMKEMGLQMYRFSVSWSRIFPINDTQVNQKGIEFYHNVIDELIKNDIEPLLTLYHWDTPIWLQCRNGFLNREAISAFENFSRVIFEQYGSKVKYFLTFNEMIIQNLQQYVWGKLTPEYKNRSDLATKAMHYSHLACAKAVKIFKQLRQENIVRSDALVGITHTEGPLYYEYNDDFEAKEHNELISNLAYFDVSFKGEYPDKLLKLWEKVGINIDITTADLKLLKENTHEFIGWNYYQPHYVSKTQKYGVSNDIFNWTEENIPKGMKTTKWNWLISPDAMINGLKRLKNRYGDMKIIITENGYGDFDCEEDNLIYDVDRIEYIKDHLEGCYQAINEENLNLIAYCYWSFQDIFSPSAGYRKRYGFVKVDFDSLKRSKKLSYYYYQDVINNLEHDTNYDLDVLKLKYKTKEK